MIDTLVQILKTDGTLVALNGTNVAPWNRDPGETAITYHLSSGVTETTLDLGNDIREERYQFDCYNGSYTDVQAMADRVELLLHLYQDDDYQLVKILNRSDGFAESDKRHRVILSLIVHRR